MRYASALTIFAIVIGPAARQVVHARPSQAEQDQRQHRQHEILEHHLEDYIVSLRIIGSRIFALTVADAGDALMLALLIGLGCWQLRRRG